MFFVQSKMYIHVWSECSSKALTACKIIYLAPIVGGGERWYIKLSITLNIGALLIARSSKY